MDLLGWKGNLRIITAIPNPNRDPEATRLRPSFFVQHNVVKLEKRGQIVKAFSEEGDTCRGVPTALLARLTEWRRDVKDAVGLSDNGR